MLDIVNVCGFFPFATEYWHWIHKQHTLTEVITSEIGLFKKKENLLYISRTAYWFHWWSKEIFLMTDEKTIRIHKTMFITDLSRFAKAFYVVFLSSFLVFIEIKRKVYSTQLNNWLKTKRSCSQWKQWKVYEYEQLEKNDEKETNGINQTARLFDLFSMNRIPYLVLIS